MRTGFCPITIVGIFGLAHVVAGAGECRALQNGLRA